MANTAPEIQATEAATGNNKTIEVPPIITVRELADLMNVSPIEIIKELMSNGIMANINQQIDFDTASIVAEAFASFSIKYSLVP